MKIPLPPGTPEPLTEPLDRSVPFTDVAEVVRAAVLAAVIEGVRHGGKRGGISGAEAVEAGFAGALTALLQAGFGIVGREDQAAVVDVLKAYIPQAWQQAAAMNEQGGVLQ